MQADYNGFRCNENRTFYGNQKIADFYVSVIGQFEIQDISGEKKKNFLLEAFYSDGREVRREMVENIKNKDFFNVFEIADTFLSADERKLITYKLMCEAARAPCQIVAVSRLGLQKINNYPLYVFGEYRFAYGDKIEGIEIKTHYNLTCCAT